MLSRFLRSGSRPPFDIDGMEREQRSHHQAAPGIARGPLQHPEQQQRVDHVEDDVDIVRPAGRHPEGGNSISCEIQVSGCQFASAKVEKRPGDGVGGQAVLDVLVVKDVAAIVVIDEGMEEADREIQQPRWRRRGRCTETAPRCLALPDRDEPPSSGTCAFFLLSVFQLGPPPASPPGRATIITNRQVLPAAAESREPIRATHRQSGTNILGSRSAQKMGEGHRTQRDNLLYSRSIQSE